MKLWTSYPIGKKKKKKKTWLGVMLCQKSIISYLKPQDFLLYDL